MFATERFSRRFDVFVSYGRVKQDAAYARSLCNGLERRGLVCFLDRRSLKPGEKVARSIELKIKRSRLFVLIGSANAISRPFVLQEIAWADEHGTPILPIDFEGSLNSSSHAAVREVHWIGETRTRLESGKPSSGAIETISRALGNRSYRRTYLGLVAMLVIVVGILGTQLLLTRSRLNEALHNASPASVRGLLNEACWDRDLYLLDDATTRDDWIDRTEEALRIAEGSRFKAYKFGEAALAIHLRLLKRFSSSWEECVQDPRMKLIGMVPQQGLIPNGRNPRTGLWEFTVGGTGMLPPQAGTRMDWGDIYGVVLVLLPPETIEQDGHELQLDAFFVARYELTLSQWRRISSETSLAPLELLGDYANLPWFASWVDFHEELGHWGLSIPTEAQWEYAARGGGVYEGWMSSGSYRWALDRPEESPIRDPMESFAWYKDHPGMDETGPVAVGLLDQNRHGLFDILGSKWEWCLDASVPADKSALRGPSTEAEFRDLSRKRTGRAIRGGSVNTTRERLGPELRGVFDALESRGDIGVRPIRALVTEDS